MATHLSGEKETAAKKLVYRACYCWKIEEMQDNSVFATAVTVRKILNSSPESGRRTTKVERIFMSCVKNNVSTFARNSPTRFFLDMLFETFTCADTTHLIVFETYDVHMYVRLQFT